MRTHRVWTMVMLSAVSTVAPAAGQNAEVDAVRNVVTAFGTFTQEKNLAGMDTLFAQDGWVHIIEGAGVNHGWADYRDHHIGPELAEFASFRYRFFAVEPQVRGIVAWTPFRYELSADTPQGHVELEGRGTAVLEKRAGRWVIVHLHTSGRRKPAP